MTNYYATFGSGHLGGFGLYYYVLVAAPNEILARKMLNKAFDGHWASIYTEDKLHDCVLKYGPIYRLGILLYADHNDELNDIYYENRLV